MLAITIRRPRNKGHFKIPYIRKKKKEKSENTARVRIQKNLIMKSTFFQYAQRSFDTSHIALPPSPNSDFLNHIFELIDSTLRIASSNLT